MNEDKPKGTGVSVSVNHSGVEAEVSEGTIARLGAVAEWLFPGKTAKATITKALAQRVSDKIRIGEPLDAQEQYFVSLVFENESRKIGNQQAVAQRVVEVLPEVSGKMKSISEGGHGDASQEFVGRAQTIAAEFSDNELRDMFARVLAGEISRPGTFSLRTLETVRLMDRSVARVFDRLRILLLDGRFAFDVGDSRKLLDKYDLSFQDQIELQDAGLVDDSLGLSLKPGNRVSMRYGNRHLQIAVPKEGQDLFISTIRLTRSALEISRVLPETSKFEYFDELGKILSDHFGKKASVSWADGVNDVWREFK